MIILERIIINCESGTKEIVPIDEKDIIELERLVQQEKQIPTLPTTEERLTAIEEALLMII